MSGKSHFSVAVVGAGAIGHDHIASFNLHPSAKVIAVADVSMDRARQAAEKFGITGVVSDYRLLLARDDIDIISIAVPNYLHATVALDALRAGKHVMLDKPMTTNARDAARLVSEAAKRKLLLMIGQSMRFPSEVQTARQLVEQGVLGDVYHAKTAWNRRAGIPRIGSWFTQRKYAGGGCIYDIGVHALDRVLYVLGDFDAAAVSGQTYSRLGTLGLGDGNWGKGEIDPKKPFDVDDLAVALIKLKSGRTVLLEASWAAHQAQPDIQFTQLYGTAAGLILPPLQIFRNGKLGYTTELVRNLPNLVNTNRMVHFVDVLLGKAKAFVKPRESLAVQKILDAIYVSAASGREVRIR